MDVIDVFKIEDAERDAYYAILTLIELIDGATSARSFLSDVRVQLEKYCGQVVSKIHFDDPILQNDEDLISRIDKYLEENLSLIKTPNIIKTLPIIANIIARYDGIIDEKEAYILDKINNIINCKTCKNDCAHRDESPKKEEYKKLIKNKIEYIINLFKGD